MRRLVILVLLGVGACRFLTAGLWPAITALRGDFAATFPTDAVARLRPGVDVSQVWQHGTGLWYYGPLQHVLTLPLLFVPSWDAVPAVWATVNVLCLALTLWVLVEGVNSWLLIGLLAGMWLLFQPLANALAQGTIEILELGVIVLGLRALVAGRPRSAGAWFGIATMIKFLPIGFLGWAVLRRQWRVVWSAVAVTAAVAVLTAMTLEWRLSVALQHLSAPWQQLWMTHHQLSLTSLYLHLGAVFDEPFPQWFPVGRQDIGLLAGAAASLGMASGYTWLFLRDARWSVWEDASILSLLLILLPPWNQDYYYLFALVPLTRLTITAWTTQDRGLWALVIVAYVCMSPPVPYGWLQWAFTAPVAHVLTWYAVSLLGALGLLYAATWQMLRTKLA